MGNDFQTYPKKEKAQDMEPDWSSLIQPPPRQRSIGSRMAIGIAGSLAVWFVADELLTYLSPWFVGGLIVVGLGICLRGGAGKRSQQFQIVLLLVAGVVGWMLLIVFFSLFKFWIIILLAAALGGVVFFKDRQGRRRQTWLDQGCCGDCGYDLRASPDRCPECGRDSSLDEPTWRKLRREWGHIKPADELPGLKTEPPPLPLPVLSIPTVLKTPDFIEGPIPLEESGANSKDAALDPDDRGAMSQ